MIRLLLSNFAVLSACACITNNNPVNIKLEMRMFRAPDLSEFTLSLI